MQALRSEVFYGNLAENGAEVRGERQVAVLIELLGGEAGPLAEDLATVNRAAEREEAGGVPVIGAVVAVLPRCSSEFAHRQDHHVVHPVAQVVIERRNSLPEFAQLLRQAVWLVGVRVPAAHLGKCHLDSDFGLYELGDLLQRLSEAPARVDRAVRGGVAAWRYLVQDRNRLETLLARAVQYIAYRAVVQCLESVYR